ncbi:MAG: hypothetical protein IPK75_06715 [Acidobacteria bacterium]|nr:hypothetical protein [Acidobacteriota bacterium]
MTERPCPHFWYPIANLILALRGLLRAARPETFRHIALDARAQLAALTAMVRRYLHVLAAALRLPPAPPLPPLPDIPDQRQGGPGAGRYRFPVIERPARRSCASAGEDDAEMQLALLLEAVQRLAEVMANPAPHALRLARRLRRFTGEALRELPVPWHVIRRIHPAVDVLLIRLDAAARPEAWAGIDTS